MSFTAEIRRSISVGGSVISDPQTITTGAKVSISEAVDDGETDLEFPNVGIDVSEVKWAYICADQDMTLETNNGAGGDDSISLLAGVPYVFGESDYAAFILGTDVDSIFMTNGSGTNGTITIEVGFDPTP